jgi:hypothetical protein
MTFLNVLPAARDPKTSRRAEVELRQLADDEVPGSGTVVVTLKNDVVAGVARRSADCDLLVLGLRRGARHKRAFGEAMVVIARSTTMASYS